MATDSELTQQRIDELIVEERELYQQWVSALEQLEFVDAIKLNNDRTLVSDMIAHLNRRLLAERNEGAE
jgi:hypothetical protein